MPQIFLANWRWVQEDAASLVVNDEGMWHPPEFSRLITDMRTKEESGKVGAANAGAGLFSSPNGAPLPTGAIIVAPTLDLAVPAARKRDWESRMQLPRNAVHGANVRDSIWSVRTENADPLRKTGLAGALPSRDGNFYQTLMGQKRNMGRFDKNIHTWVLRKLRMAYAESPRPVYLRWLCEKYGFLPQEIAVPSGGATSSTETFDGDAAAVGGFPYAWTEETGAWENVGGEASREGTGSAIAVARNSDFDTDGDDVSAQVTSHVLNSNNSRAGPMVRHQSDGDGYFCVHFYSTTQLFRFGKIDGAPTHAASGFDDSSTSTYEADLNLKFKIIDQAMEVFYDGSDPPTTSMHTWDESADTFTTGTQGGIYGRATAAGRAVLDDWTIRDEAGGAPAAPRGRHIVGRAIGAGIGRGLG